MTSLIAFSVRDGNSPRRLDSAELCLALRTTRLVEPLARFPVARTCHPAELRGLSERLGYGPLETHAYDPCTFDYAVNATTCGSLRLAYERYGSTIEVGYPEPTSWFALTWTLHEESRLTHRGAEAACSPDRGAVISPGGGRWTYRHPKNVEVLTVRFEQLHVERVLSALTGERLGTPLVLRPSIDFRSGVGASVRALLLHLLNDLNQEDGLSSSPTALALFQDAIVAALLAEHPHTYERALAGAPRRSAPRIVRQVEAYLEAHAAEPVTMAALAEVTGVGLRSIQATFKQYRGYSPLQFLKSVRLRAVRGDLLSGEANSVTKTALEHGFTRLSAFATDYRGTFGELPSETLRRASGGSSARVTNGVKAAAAPTCAGRPSVSRR